MPHVDPLPRDANPEFVEKFNHYENTRGFIPNSILTMQRRPNIAKAFMEMNQAVLYEGTVQTELKMLVSLMASYAGGCLYCQSHMTNLSTIYQASDEKIAAIWNFEKSDVFSDAERAALVLARNAAVSPNAVTAEDFENLRQYFDDAEIVEIVAAISLFGYLNRWNDTMATELEDVPKQVAERVIEPTGWTVGKHEGNQ